MCVCVSLHIHIYVQRGKSTCEERGWRERKKKDRLIYFYRGGRRRRGKKSVQHNVFPLLLLLFARIVLRFLSSLSLSLSVFREEKTKGRKKTTIRIYLHSAVRERKTTGGEESRGSRARGRKSAILARRECGGKNERKSPRELRPSVFRFLRERKFHLAPDYSPQKARHHERFAYIDI